MKKIVLILLLNFCFVSCYSQKATSDIIYFLPSSVTEVLNKEFQQRTGNSNTYIVLDKENIDTYIIYLSNPDSPKNFWAEHSNRSVFLQGKLIPLYFYSDEHFSFAEKGEIVLKKLGTEEGIRKINTIRDNVFKIKFKLNGEIIK
ncbi:hypothetical protein QWZ06_10175 [Chryseobacterium tructae]|uniref:Beta-lactamase-inhibitor-like PepSY-like domain-containing protein n=1 Tax=Chryseobacterium tructae TaxID=1037380 RepID=A0ABV7XV39_9FLAO|nr:hypothetical protein [Chryseobacterium tructae]MDN3692617.1 hypothetical protein [Chryseobacterium tructae]